MKRTVALVCALLLLLLLAQSAFAISSALLNINWSNLLSGSGGSAVSSGYKLSLTVGQTISGSSSSPLYKVQMGYWAGYEPINVYLPRIMRNP
jgi:hypothetical protein